MGKALCNGQMVQSMRENGKIIMLGAGESSLI